MDKVGVRIAETDRGLHAGHEAVINFGKQFGQVTVELSENLLERNHYFETGTEPFKHKVNLEKLEDDCARLGVALEKPVPTRVSEEERIKVYNQAKAFMNVYRDYLLSERYIKQIMFSLMDTRLTRVSRKYDLMVGGPEVPNFFFKQIAPILGGTERKIYQKIIKNEHGVKRSSSHIDIPFDLRNLRKVIDEVKGKYALGNNEELVKELNLSYPESVGWRVHDIQVYEGGFIEGRVEVTSFLYQNALGWPILEEVDYYG